MPQCQVCGNDYDKSFTIELQGERHVFDSFECAIHALAPTCAHCGCRVIGHGVETTNGIFCGAHCATREGADQVVDRTEEELVDNTSAESFPASDAPARY